MRKRLQLTAMMLLMLSAGSGAKDLGTWGNVFEPAEQDMLAFIQNRLKGMEQTGELDRLRKEATERVKEHAVRPTPVEGLSNAKEYRSFAWDPTFTVKETITDMQGNVIARKGDTVNPLDKVPFSQVLFFIDGDDKEQVNWARQQLVFFSGLTALPAQADVNGDLNGFFNNLGYSGNVTQAQAWQGQAAGYFSGGSVYLRNPVKNVQLVSMQLPSLNAGCGGTRAGRNAGGSA